MKMNKIKIFSLIVVFTALFVGFEKLNAQDVTKFKCLKTLEGHSGWVRSVAFSPDGTKIISGSSDKTVKIWGEE
jgi:WD40 repeat protein